jgi:putative pyruvate formate lyase activating enzyme
MPPKLAAAKAELADCRICPRNCGVNRLKDELGVCNIGDKARRQSPPNRPLLSCAAKDALLPGLGPACQLSCAACWKHLPPAGITEHTGRQLHV